MRIINLCLFAGLLAGSVYGQELAVFDSALAQVGRSTADVSFDQEEMAAWGGDTYRLNNFTLLHKNPFKLPQHGQLVFEALKSDIDKITGLVSLATRRIDAPVRRGLIGDQLQKYTVSQDSLPLQSISRGKNILPDSKYARLKDKIDLIFRLADDKEFLFTKGIKEADKDRYRKQLFEAIVLDSTSQADVVEELAELIDLNRMAGGAQDFVEAVRRLADSLEFCTFPDAKLDIETRQGLIVIGTAKDDKYLYPFPPLLIVDGGGNDTYEIYGYPEKSSMTAIVDAGGNDVYRSTDSMAPGIGGAILGISVLIDKAGDDHYEAASVAQGCGIFGAGVLWDLSGNDTYSARFYSQAAASFGVGLLIDSSGNDSLYCRATSQGFGYTKGCGLLVNGSGDDKYVAEDAILFSPSAQTKDHNSSLAQGVGFGRRADFIDGHSWAGGVGILCDISGRDSYSAGLFAQGCAYWFAVGMLLEGGGDDTYNGIWYVQGAGAHFGVAYLDDFAGNDTYTARMNMAIGAGHDFTIGYFNEREGNDTYTVPNLSLGGGNANGIGIFCDHAGDDKYTTTGGTTLGRANAESVGTRAILGVWGIFVDEGGTDTYNEGYAGNGRRWIGPPSKPEAPNRYEVGVGLDR